MTNRTATILALAALIISLGVGVFAVSHPAAVNKLGAAGGLLAENYLPFIMYNGGFNTAKSIKTTGDLTVGSSGTAVTQVLKGTCSLIAPSFVGLAASTSIAMDCAVTGVQSGDVVIAMFATSTASGVGPGWEVVGSSASTTSGFITLNITNGTGASALMPASIASTTQYLILR